MSSTKYKIRIQRAPAFSAESFESAVLALREDHDEVDAWTREPLAALYVDCVNGGEGTDMHSIYSELRSPDSRLVVAMRMFWTVLLAEQPDIVADFQADPFSVEAESLTVAAASVAGRLKFGVT